jgi:hypothetical protein
MHKTGSTAIQSAFNGFNDGNTRYLDLGSVNHSVPFFTAYSSHYQSYHIWKRAGLTSEQVEHKKRYFLEKISRELADTKHNIIISGEDISLLSISELKEVQKLFDCHTKLKIIAYVRPPISFIRSSFQEKIKNGESLTVPPSPRYRFRIEKFFKVFGRENVIVRRFDKNELYCNDIVRDFAKLISVSAPESGSNSNVSLSTEAVKIIYLLNQMVPAFGETKENVQARRRMINHVRQKFPGRFELPDHLIFGCVDFEDIEWLYSAADIDFRIPDTSASIFSMKALDAHLSTLAPDTIFKIGDYLKRECGLAAAPQDIKFLLARYFMSFVKTDLKMSGMFDPNVYLELNPDVKAAGIDPYKHYLMHGYKEGRRIK